MSDHEGLTGPRCTVKGCPGFGEPMTVCANEAHVVQFLDDNSARHRKAKAVSPREANMTFTGALVFHANITDHKARRRGVKRKFCSAQCKDYARAHTLQVGPWLVDTERVYHLTAPGLPEAYSMESDAGEALRAAQRLYAAVREAEPDMTHEEASRWVAYVMEPVTLEPVGNFSLDALREGSDVTEPIEPIEAYNLPAPESVEPAVLYSLDGSVMSLVRSLANRVKRWLNDHPGEDVTALESSGSLKWMVMQVEERTGNRELAMYLAKMALRGEVPDPYEFPAEWDLFNNEPREGLNNGR